MVEYKKTFLDKMKALFLYFVEFNKNRLILSKDYLKDYIVDGLNKRLIIMIIHNKSIFLANNR